MFVLTEFLKPVYYTAESINPSKNTMPITEANMLTIRLALA